MAGTRKAPTIITDPGDITGENYATRVAAETDDLWNKVITPVGSIGGTANSITGVSSPALIAAPVDGQTFRFIPSLNNTGATTVNLDGRGATALRDCDGNALQSGDLIALRPYEFFYRASSGFYRLSYPTQRALLAALASAVSDANTGWEKIDDTTVGSPVSQIQHTFTAGDYSAVRLVFSELSPSNSSSTDITVTLRDSGGVILTTNITHPTSQYGASDEISNSVEFVVPLSEGADRIRIIFSASNIDDGRVVSYGLKL